MSGLNYQELRERFAPCAWHEPVDGYEGVPVSERLVQAVWFDQRLKRDQLQTVDGKPLRIVSPGWWNLEAGPDFRRAVVGFGERTPKLGDVEVHLRASDWRAHGHDRDPSYNDVLLHVVLWQTVNEPAPVTAAGRAVKRIALFEQLEAPLEQLYDEIDPDSYPYNLDSHTGLCLEPLKTLPPAAVLRLLDEAGWDRLQSKARRLMRWTQRDGVEQTLYAGVLEALGYKHNKEPMRRLAAALPLARLRSLPAIEVQALLLGMAGFLPRHSVAAHDEETRRLVKLLWDGWWKVREEFAERALPRETWRLSSLRPANFPWRRLAAVSQLLSQHWELWPKVAEALSAPERSRGARLEALFTDLEDPYWSRRYSFDSKPQPKSEVLIGGERARDIVLNVLLPVALAQSKLLKQPALAEAVRSVFMSYAASDSNALVRFTAHRLFGQRPPKEIRSAARQQGLLQIFHDFCLADRSACKECKFPALVREVGRAVIGNSGS